MTAAGKSDSVATHIDGGSSAIKHKICLVGDFAVGKTSLARRFVSRVFDERYQTTVGVRIDVKLIERGLSRHKLIIWDIAGTDEFDTVSEKYLEGADGLLLVCDATREHTLDSALNLVEHARRVAGGLPSIGLVNKVDLVDQRRIDTALIDALRDNGQIWQETSARTGAGVEDAFAQLLERMLAANA